MMLGCLLALLALTVLLVFGSYLQLLYLESLRLIKNETPALTYFRDVLSHKLAYDTEGGALRFSLVKHVSLPITGALVYCALIRPEVAQWQLVLESAALSVLLMLVATYVIPQFLYRRLQGAWMLPLVPFAQLLGRLIAPISAPLSFFQSLLDLGTPEGSSDHNENHSEHI